MPTIPLFLQKSGLLSEVVCMFSLEVDHCSMSQLAFRLRFIYIANFFFFVGRKGLPRLRSTRSLHPTLTVSSSTGHGRRGTGCTSRSSSASCPCQSVLTFTGDWGMLLQQSFWSTSSRLILVFVHSCIYTPHIALYAFYINYIHMYVYGHKLCWYIHI